MDICILDHFTVIFLFAAPQSTIKSPTPACRRCTINPPQLKSLVLHSHSGQASFSPVPKGYHLCPLLHLLRDFGLHCTFQGQNSESQT